MARRNFPNLLLQLLHLATLVSCSPRAAPSPAITPFAAAPLRPRQDDDGDIALTCGYIDAYILSPVGCSQGSTCLADVTANVAGICCRLGDTANCPAVTSCVASNDLSASCDGDCSSNNQITKCSDAESAYCYTRYWVSAGRTPTEIGCTTTPGYSDYVYTTYTVRGETIDFGPTGTPATSATIGRTGATSSATSDGSSGGSAGAGESSGDANIGSSSGTSDNSGDSVPAGAIAGGVVGGVVALGLIAAIIVWIVLRHRRQSRAAAWNQGGAPAAAASSTAGADEKSPKSPVQATSPISPIQATEAGQQPDPQTHEIASNEAKYELHHQNKVPELP